jgi:CCR4-NOT complex subunit CAF16
MSSSDSPPLAAPAVEVRGLDFAYPDGPPVLRQLSLTLPPGVRCLLVGANGSGKSTLLNLIAGRHLIPEAAVRVLGRPAFADTSLVARVALLGGPFPLDVDLGVDELLARRPADLARRERLMELLAIDPRWRMSRISDGQRRRVQLLLGLLGPSDLLLLDEVTTDLDVIARADLLSFLRAETTERGATIFYATHILDGLDGWATHLAFLSDGAIRWMGPLGALRELQELHEASVPSPLLRLVERWLRDG